MYRWFLLLAVLVSAALGLLVGVLNPDPVIIDLALVAPQLPLGGLILLVFAIGVIVGLLLFWILFDLPARVRRRTRQSKSSGSGLPARHG